GHRRQAPPHVAGRRERQAAAQPAGRPAVVGRGDHGGGPPRVAADGPDRRRQAVTTPDGHDVRTGAHRPAGPVLGVRLPVTSPVTSRRPGAPRSPADRVVGAGGPPPRTCIPNVVALPSIRSRLTGCPYSL